MGATRFLQMAATTSAVCLNCGAALTGAYCARCGQKATSSDLTLAGFLHETTHELTHWDGKVPATLKALFFKPGLLTADFLAGRRARWLTPLRVYLICSVALFGGRALIEETGLRTTREMAGVSFTRRDTTGPLTPEERELYERSPLARIFGVDRVERATRDSKRFNREFEAALPKAMFILLPVFALLTNLAWRKSHPRYPAHLYVALHIHAAVFSAFLILSIVVGLIPSRTIAALAGLSFAGYVVWYGLVAFHRVFRDSWPKTVVKALAVGIAYDLCLFVVLFGFLVYAVLRM
ncbi:MAG: DUF3667 domain-containing protein [Acidobacteriota bacterium]